MRLLLLLLTPALALPAILPDTIAKWQKGAATPAAVPEQKIWAEYGFQESETAPYSDGVRKFTASAWRFTDTTGAYAAFLSVRPQGAQPSTPQVTDVAVDTATDRIAVVGNYLIRASGYKLADEEMNHVVALLPKYSHAAMPPIREHIPSGAIPNSDRYILGPDGLAKFAPAIPAATAAFNFSSEAVATRYMQGGREQTLVVFNYPAMEMARKQLPLFEAIPKAVVKRSGPLVAVVLDGAGSDDAQKLLSQVRYQAQITMAEHVPTQKDNPGNLFWNLFILVLILVGFCLVSGVLVGGFMYMFRRSGATGEGEDMISLHISGRS